MPLVNRAQIPQDLGVSAIPTHPAAQWDMFKMAGTETALTDLGLLPEEGMEKEALIGALRAGGGLLWKGLKGLWGAGSKAVDAVAKPIGNAANRAVAHVGGLVGASPARIQQIQDLGKGMAGEAIGFGALSGGLNAAFADPGERGSAFLKGFGSGALGGLAWRGAGNLATAGMKKGLGAKRFGKLEATSKGPVIRPSEAGPVGFGQRMKNLGAKALVGGVPFAASMAASMYTPTFEGGHTSTQQAAPYAARLTGGSMISAYPQHPMGFRAYQNPNLPMPQYGY